MPRVRWTVKQYLTYLKKGGFDLTAVRKSLTQAGGAHAEAQTRLLNAMEKRWPGRFKPEQARLVPGRRFRADAADRRAKLVIEVDGYRSHGLSRRGFYKDRDRDMELTIAGWRILRVPAGMILKDIALAMSKVERFVNAMDAIAEGKDPV